LAVALSLPSSNEVTIRYTVTGGTAHAGSDFNSSAATLTFSAGQKSKYIALIIINNKVDEMCESGHSVAHEFRNLSCRRTGWPRSREHASGCRSTPG
jgi:hypothetical protein